LWGQKIPLGRLFDIDGITEVRPLVKNGRAEQIDRAFELAGWHYFVESRWHERAG